VGAAAAAFGAVVAVLQLAPALGQAPPDASGIAAGLLELAADYAARSSVSQVVPELTGSAVAGAALAGRDGVSLARALVADAAERDAVFGAACERLAYAAPRAALPLAQAIESPLERDRVLALVALPGAAGTSDGRVQALGSLGVPVLGAESALRLARWADGPTGAEALGLLRHIPDEARRSAALAALARRSALPDPRAAQEAVQALSEPEPRIVGLTALAPLKRQAADTSARKDLDEAISLLDRVRDSRRREELRRDVAVALGPYDPVRAVKLLEADLSAAPAIRRAEERFASQDALVRAVGAIDARAAGTVIDQAAESARALRPAVRGLEARVTLAQSVAAFDRSRGLALLEQASIDCRALPATELSVAERSDVLQSIAVALFGLDPDRAWGVVDEILGLAGSGGDGHPAPGVALWEGAAAADAARAAECARRSALPALNLGRVAEALCGHDPAQASALGAEALRLAGDSAELCDEIAGRLAPRLAPTGSHGALAMAQMVGPERRDAVLAGTLAAAPPEAAAGCLDLAQSVVRDTERQVALAAVIAGIAAQDSERAVQLASSFAADERLLADVLIALAPLAPEAARARLDTMRDTRSRDEVRSAVAVALASRGAPTAGEVAEGIIDPDLRSRCLADLSDAVPALAPKAAALAAGLPDKRAQAAACAYVAHGCAGNSRVAAAAADRAFALASELGSAAFAPAAWCELVAHVAVASPDQAMTLAGSSEPADTAAWAYSRIAEALGPAGTEGAATARQRAVEAAARIEDPYERSQRLTGCANAWLATAPEAAQAAAQAALEAAFAVPEPLEQARARADVALAMAPLDPSAAQSWAYAVGALDPVEAIRALVTIGGIASEQNPLGASFPYDQAAHLAEQIGPDEDLDAGQAAALRVEQLLLVASELATVPGAGGRARELAEQASATLRELGPDAEPELTAGAARDIAVIGCRLDAESGLAAAEKLPAEIRAGVLCTVASGPPIRSDLLDRALEAAQQVTDAGEAGRLIEGLIASVGPAVPDRAEALAALLPDDMARAEVLLRVSRALGAGVAQSTPQG